MGDWHLNMLNLLMFDLWNDDAQQTGVEFRGGAVAVDVDGEVEGAEDVADQALVHGQMGFLFGVAAVGAGRLARLCLLVGFGFLGFHDGHVGQFLFGDLWPDGVARHQERPHRGPAQVQFRLVPDAGQLDFDVEVLQRLPDVGFGLVDVQVPVVECPVQLVRHVGQRHVVEMVSLFRIGVRHVGGWVGFNVWVEEE